MSDISVSMTTPYSIHAVISEFQDYYIKGTVKPTERYSESYEYETSFEDQIIPTRNKFLLDDIVVKKIPVHTAGNDAGGYTLNIGG